MQKIPFKIFYGEKPKIVVSFSEFVHIAYITKQDKFNNQIIDKTFKSIMVVYAYNHTRGTYKFYNTETNRVIMTRDVKWSD